MSEDIKPGEELLNKEANIIPFLEWHDKIYEKIRNLLKTDISQQNFREIFFFYLRTLKENLPIILSHSQPERYFVQKPTKVLCLFRQLYRNTHEFNSYNLKLSEFLAILTTLELKYASNFIEPKMQIANRICRIYKLHLENLDISHILRIFLYLKREQLFDQTEVLTKIFEKYLKNFTHKMELDDELYCMYLVAYNLWRCIEWDVYERNSIMEYANKMISPKPSLFSNKRYIKHLPKHLQNDENITKNILEKGFNEQKLIEELLSDEYLQKVVVINLSDDENSDKIINLDQELTSLKLEPINLQFEKPEIVDTIDLTDSEQHVEKCIVDKKMPRLNKLINSSRRFKRKLRNNTVQSDIIDLDEDSDDDIIIDDEESDVQPELTQTNFPTKNKETEASKSPTNKSVRHTPPIVGNVDSETCLDKVVQENVNPNQKGAKSPSPCVNEIDSSENVLNIVQEKDGGNNLPSKEQQNLPTIVAATSSTSSDIQDQPNKNSVTVETNPISEEIIDKQEKQQQEKQKEQEKQQQQQKQQQQEQQQQQQQQQQKQSEESPQSNVEILENDSPDSQIIPIFDEDLSYLTQPITRTYSKQNSDNIKDSHQISTRNQIEISKDVDDDEDDELNLSVTSSSPTTSLSSVRSMDYSPISIRRNSIVNDRENVSNEKEKQIVSNEKLIHQVRPPKKVNFAPLPKKHNSNPNERVKKKILSKRMRRDSNFKYRLSDVTTTSELNLQSKSVNSNLILPPVNNKNITSSINSPLNDNFVAKSENRPCASTILAETGIKSRPCDIGVTGTNNKFLSNDFDNEYEKNARNSKNFIQKFSDSVSNNKSLKTLSGTTVIIESNNSTQNFDPDSTTVVDEKIIDKKISNNRMDCESDNNLNSKINNFKSIVNIKRQIDESSTVEQKHKKTPNSVIIGPSEISEDDEETLSNATNTDHDEIARNLAELPIIQDTDLSDDIDELEHYLINGSYGDVNYKDITENLNMKEGQSLSLPLKKRRKLSTFSDNLSFKDEDLHFLKKLRANFSINNVSNKQHQQEQQQHLKKIASQSQQQQNTNVVTDFIDSVSYPSTPMLSIANFENIICLTTSSTNQNHLKINEKTNRQPVANLNFSTNPNQNLIGQPQFTTNSINEFTAPKRNLPSVNILSIQQTPATTIIENNCNTDSGGNIVRTYNILPPSNNQTFLTGTANSQTINLIPAPVPLNSNNYEKLSGCDNTNLNFGIYGDSARKLESVKIFPPGSQQKSGSPFYYTQREIQPQLPQQQGQYSMIDSNFYQQQNLINQLQNQQQTKTAVFNQQNAQTQQQQQHSSRFHIIPSNTVYTTQQQHNINGNNCSQMNETFNNGKAKINCSFVNSNNNCPTATNIFPFKSCQNICNCQNQCSVPQNNSYNDSKDLNQNNSSNLDIDMSNYNLNHQHLKNYLCNSQYNLQAKKTILNDIHTTDMDTSCKKLQNQQQTKTTYYEIQNVASPKLTTGTIKNSQMKQKPSGKPQAFLSYMNQCLTTSQKCTNQKNLQETMQQAKSKAFLNSNSKTICVCENSSCSSRVEEDSKDEEEVHKEFEKDLSNIINTTQSDYTSSQEMLLKSDDYCLKRKSKVVAEERIARTIKASNKLKNLKISKTNKKFQ